MTIRPMLSADLASIRRSRGYRQGVWQRARATTPVPSRVAVSVRASWDHLRTDQPLELRERLREVGERADVLHLVAESGRFSFDD